MTEISNNGSGNGNMPVGSALVVGAGIGGMQASLDLAEAGIKVYLMERSPAIGGIMAQLDKVFPTNDCSMCVISPKLVEVGRHLNIDILTTSELEEISGEPGNFQVKIRRKPRYVDIDACTGCGDCADVCPTVRPNKFNEGLSDRRAIYRLYPQAMPNAFGIEKLGVAPCRDACPINQRAQGYIDLVREGRFADAYRTIKEDNPFPSVCGRICDRRCEDACLRAKSDSPVNIMALKRFVTDWAREHPQELYSPDFETIEKSGKKIAVIGSGAAGLSCASDLVRMGHTVTVFEALSVPGGMMRVSTPEYRLPHDVLQKEIDDILEMGVDLRLNNPVNDVSAVLGKGFNAVFVAIGAHQSERLSIPGIDLPQVISGSDFMRDVNLKGEKGDLVESVRGRRVLVLGANNLAVDAARSALRLGASWAGIACLESREKMTAFDPVIQDALDEGVEISTSRSYGEITQKNGAVSGLQTSKVDFRGSVDGDHFEIIPGTEQWIEADMIILASASHPELGCLGENINTDGHFIKIDQETLETSFPGIFAGGDAVSGSLMIVDAIAAGHKAAHSIDLYLQGKGLDLHEASPPVVHLETEEIQRRLSEKVSPYKRTETIARPAGERRNDFLEVYAGLTEDEARAEAARCLSCGICSECLQCVYACQADAIFHNQVEEIIELNVGSVVLTPGMELMPGDIRPEFGYGHYPNVLTSLEFERMLSPTGPHTGAVKRPSDLKHPRKVAWIQCVGSRDTSCGNGYCSSICCLYSTEEAIIAKEHDANIEPTIFYMDIRAFGKNYESYIERAQKGQTIRYVRSIVSAVREVPGTKNLRLSYATFDENGKPISFEEEFDMVVLVVGLRATEHTQQMARRLGIDLNEFGFAEVHPFHPTESSIEGVFVAGTFCEPKDIPETMIEASCASAKASGILASARGTMTRTAVYPPERDISEEEPSVGVFVCHCGINIGSIVDVPGVVEFARNIPGVTYAEDNLYTCSQDTQIKIAATIREKGLNRVVAACCTPRTHESLYQDTIQQAGLNRYLFELANIREQDSWVHRSSPDLATQKAKQLVAMAIEKTKRLRPLDCETTDIEYKALVIGGGLSGMTAALSIASQGFPVYLLEREANLGGNLRHIHVGLNGSDPQLLLKEMIERIRDEPRITVLLEIEITTLGGYVGQFQTKIRNIAGEESELEHGVIILATGARGITPASYEYGKIENVITQRELEESLEEHFPKSLENKVDSVVMIQCVESRDEAHPYCSRICCTQAIKNALEIKKRSPGTA
ncbi:MAG: FAD-dependent oxidoreductase, partial [Anaerolineaceae bacterium]|nr:FAD-dependent oxidoreductase [Anaerolineaceae bacterium]